MSVKHVGKALRSAVHSIASIGWLSLTLAACLPPSGLANATLPHAIDAANRQHRPLIIELSASWCYPCQVFWSQVLTDPRVKQALADVVFVSYDIDTSPGYDAMNRCGVNSVPAVFGIDRYGYIRLRKTDDRMNADEFLAFIRQAHEVLAESAH